MGTYTPPTTERVAPDHRLAAPPRAVSDRSLVAHLTDLTEETVTLFRKEVELAKAETREKLGELRQGATQLAVGSVLLHTGALVLVAAVLFGLATVWPAWVAALVVGTVLVSVGGGALWSGKRNLEPTNLIPERTLESVSRDTDMVKEHL